ncbi:MAG: purine-binding chemotaxis protein CheW [Gammaproteobacteria bacterium]|nr:MAG: purine-binding chemotaxis protein CheW [Gammaproteobacteria bacterium]
MSAVADFDTPFALLSRLDRLCRERAAGLPTSEQVREDWTGVEFRLHGIDLLAAMSEVAEIIAVPALTRIPGVKPWVLGMGNMRGMLLPVIDLERFIFGERIAGSGYRRMLVVRMGDALCGLLVQEVHGMRHYWVDEKVAELPEGIDGRLEPYLEHAFEREHRRVPVFSVEKLLESEAFMDVAT